MKVALSAPFISHRDLEMPKMLPPSIGSYTAFSN